MGVGRPHHAPTALPEKDILVSILEDTGWAPRTVWTGAENLAHARIQSPDRPAHSESLYRLRYSGPRCSNATT